MSRNPDTGRFEIGEQEFILMLMRQVAVASRCALGDGLRRETIAEILRSEADAIMNPASVAEDMSPISVPME